MVQSYDGHLTFFEQEALAFSRHLPDFLLPGPLAYAAAADSFITSTASLELVAYKYSVLAAASGTKEQQQGQYNHSCWIAELTVECIHWKVFVAA